MAAVCYFVIMRNAACGGHAMMRDPMIPLEKKRSVGYTKEFLAGIDYGLRVKPDDRSLHRARIPANAWTLDVSRIRGRLLRHSRAETLESTLSPVPTVAATAALNRRADASTYRDRQCRRRRKRQTAPTKPPSPPPIVKARRIHGQNSGERDGGR